MNQSVIQDREPSRETTIKRRISEIRAAISTEEAHTAAHHFPECLEALGRMRERLAVFEERLEAIPPIDVAVLGPSRHGKSTLLNSLVGVELLPTSDIKPCTASIVKMRWSAEWALRVRFVEKDQLVSDLREAVKDAREALSHERRGEDDFTEDDPALIRSVLQRFIELFEVDPDLPPDDLIEAVQTGRIPRKVVRLLGHDTRARATDVANMRSVIEKYLSTSDVYWTIVEQCEISGPFAPWHPSLSLVDLPGTNDTDPQRTAVTNSMRESATAVAIVTSDSNIGPDIESWLRNSSVLANFLEATRKRRQRLFIIRTKLDSFHPHIEESLLKDASEEEETRIHMESVHAYKQEQSKTFHQMLRDIASPKLPRGDDDHSRRQRVDLLNRIDDIQVFFVSALAHEVFCNRYSAAQRTKRQLSDYFGNDINATGIPQLREFLLTVASEYLSDNFFEDIDNELESEVRLLAAAFRKSETATKAELAGGQTSLQMIVTTVQKDVIPWLNNEVAERASDFKATTLSGASGIQHRLSQVEALSKRRFEDKINIWASIHWASLRAVARKNGVHVTGRGRSIDLNEDICSVLIDDVLLAWTSFRDHLVSNQVSAITNDLAEELSSRLYALQTHQQIPEVTEAVEVLTNQLVGITRQQRHELMNAVNEKIAEVESIRKPAYDIAREEMNAVLVRIQNESGAGCSARMQDVIRRDAPAAINRIRSRVNQFVLSAVSDLNECCAGALNNFGTSAAAKIDKAMSHVSNSLVKRDAELLNERMIVVTTAMKRLPTPSGRA